VTLKSREWIVIGKVLGACIAGFGIALLYRFGLADVGAVLTLSAIIVSLITFVRSGALSASWLKTRDRQSIIRARYWELAKAFGCAGIGVDLVRVLRDGISYRYMPSSALSAAILLTVAVVTAMGAGLFLTRWFAAYLFGRRR
jgi:hypothetical protein